jgi:hypothetical protein
VSYVDLLIAKPIPPNNRIARITISAIAQPGRPAGFHHGVAGAGAAAGPGAEDELIRPG